MSLKRTIALGLIAAGMCGTVYAAHDLTIINNTKFNATTRINHSLCSTDALGEKEGTTYSGTTHVIGGFKVQAACLADEKTCQADVYMQDKCGGPVVAHVTFDALKNGITSPPIPVDNSGFKVTGSGFTAQIDPA